MILRVGVGAIIGAWLGGPLWAGAVAAAMTTDFAGKVLTAGEESIVSKKKALNGFGKRRKARR
jgi:type III secretory pathway component EscT